MKIYFIKYKLKGKQKKNSNQMSANLNHSDLTIQVTTSTSYFLNNFIIKIILLFK